MQITVQLALLLDLIWAGSHQSWQSWSFSIWMQFLLQEFPVFARNGTRYIYWQDNTLEIAVSDSFWGYLLQKDFPALAKARNDSDFKSVYNNAAM